MTSVSSGWDLSSDAELITAVRTGDTGAYGVLYERHVAAARAVARQYSNSAADAEDAVSEAFSKVLSAITQGGGPDVAFRAYLFTALRRVALTRVEAGRRAAPTDEMETFERAFGEVESTEGPTLAGFERGVVSEAYRSLPERWQAVLWYTEVEELSPAEIAPVLGLTANGVAALAYRAREGLRQAYLQQHLAAPVDEACTIVNKKLGAYVRGGLAKRETAMVEMHLDDCGTCRGLVLELGDVNHGMRAFVAPLVLGAVAVGVLQGIGFGGAAGAAAATAGAAGAAGAGAAGAGASGAGAGSAGAGGSGAGGAGGAGAGGAGAAGGAGTTAGVGAGAGAGGGALVGSGAVAGSAAVVGGASTVAAVLNPAPAAAAGGGAAAAGAGAGAAGGAAVAGSAAGLAGLVASVPVGALGLAVAGVVVAGGLGVAGAMGAFDGEPDDAPTIAAPADEDTASDEPSTEGGTGSDGEDPADPPTVDPVPVEPGDPTDPTTIPPVDDDDGATSTGARTTQSSTPAQPGPTTPEPPAEPGPTTPEPPTQPGAPVLQVSDNLSDLTFQLDEPTPVEVVVRNTGSGDAGTVSTVFQFYDGVTGSVVPQLRGPSGAGVALAAASTWECSDAADHTSVICSTPGVPKGGTRVLTADLVLTKDAIDGPGEIAVGVATWLGEPDTAPPAPTRYARPAQARPADVRVDAADQRVVLNHETAVPQTLTVPVRNDGGTSAPATVRVAWPVEGGGLPLDAVSAGEGWSCTAAPSGPPALECSHGWIAKGTSVDLALSFDPTNLDPRTAREGELLWDLHADGEVTAAVVAPTARDAVVVGSVAVHSAPAELHAAVAQPDVLGPGAWVEASLVVDNLGATTVTDAVVRVTLPDGMGLSAQDGWGHVAGTTYRRTLGAVGAAGVDVPMPVHAPPGRFPSGEYDVTLTVTAGSSEWTDDAVLRVRQTAADLSGSRFVLPAAVGSEPVVLHDGESTTAEITVINSGGTAVDAEVVLDLPDGVRLTDTTEWSVDGADASLARRTVPVGPTGGDGDVVEVVAVITAGVVDTDDVRAERVRTIDVTVRHDDVVTPRSAHVQLVSAPADLTGTSSLSAATVTGEETADLAVDLANAGGTTGVAQVQVTVPSGLVVDSSDGWTLDGSVASREVEVGPRGEERVVLVLRGDADATTSGEVVVRTVFGQVVSTQSHPVTVRPAPHPALALEVAPTTYLVEGRDSVVSVTVRNDGPGDAGPVTVVVDMPPGGFFEGVTSGSAWYCASGSGANRDVPCSLPGLAAGTSSVLTFVVSGNVDDRAIALRASTAATTDVTATTTLQTAEMWRASLGNRYDVGDVVAHSDDWLYVAERDLLLGVLQPGTDHPGWERIVRYR